MAKLKQFLCRADTDEELTEGADELQSHLKTDHGEHTYRTQENYKGDFQKAPDGAILTSDGTSQLYTDLNHGTSPTSEDSITYQTTSLLSCENVGKPAQSTYEIPQFQKLKVNEQVVIKRNEVPVEIKPEGAIPTNVHSFDKFPFLCDEGTVDFIRRSHTIFIMRGLPGSGKSQISECLEQTYPEAVVCSADHFFTDKEGNYNFDRSLLNIAHGRCQEKATQSCEKDTRVIIIDNTNIQRWTMSHYVRLAQSMYFYHLMIVEPKTPWRYDVEELSRRNSHGVDKETLSQKLESLRNQVYTPMYYGWFLSKQDSSMLSQKCIQHFKQCLEEMVADSIEDQYLPSDILSDLNGYKYVNPKPMLHCTASYLGSNRQNPYHEQEVVLNSIGRKFSLAISGFFASEKAICALVDLNSSDLSDSAILLELFKKEEEQEIRDRHHGRNSSEINLLKVQKYFKHGCSAHITITFAHGQQAKVSGNELLGLFEKQFQATTDPYVKTYISTVGQMSCYGQNMFHLSLPKPLIIDSLFHGFYSNHHK